MKEVSVVLAWRLDESQKQQIAAVDPRLQIADISLEFLNRYRSALPPHAQRGDPSQPPERVEALLREAEVLLSWWRLPENLVARAPKLKWIQFVSAGVDRSLPREIIQSSILVSSASGIHATPIAEYVLGVMLALTKRFPSFWANQQARRWERLLVAELRDRTVGVVGLGHIGSEVARLARAFGMRVLASRRSATQRVTGLDNVDELFPSQELPRLLASSDFVVLAVPLNPETRHLLGEKELRTMKPTSYLINISRGAVVDEGALVKALKERWMAGAALDVFEREPLPPESELWGLSHVILTPHISGTSEKYNARLTELFCDNLRRYLAGLPLRNLVDKARGY